MNDLPLALAMETMKVAGELTSFRDFDCYCSRQGNFATTLNAASVFDSGTTLARDHRLFLLGWGA
jgi:hypothetical protein